MCCVCHVLCVRLYELYDFSLGFVENVLYKSFGSHLISNTATNFEVTGWGV
jgi:hypothetical protein